MTDPTSKSMPQIGMARPMGYRRAVVIVVLVVVVVAGLLWVNRDRSDRATTLPTGDGQSESAPDPIDESVELAGSSGISPVPSVVEIDKPTQPEIPPATRILVVGDSVSAQIGWSLHEWGVENPGLIEVWNESHLGCGTVRYGEKRVGDGAFGPVGDVCSNWAVPVPPDTVAESEVVSWSTALEVFRPDIVVIIISSWDVTDRIVPGVVDDWSSIGNLSYDSYVFDEYAAATELLTSTSATLFWLTSPYLNGGSVPVDHPVRVDGINRIVREAVATVDGRDVRFIDYPAFLGPNGEERELLMRDDGVHLSAQGFDEVGGWLLEQMGLIEEMGRS